MLKRSKIMDVLYGEKTAEKVFERIEYLDHALNEEIQKIAYDHYWALPGISTRDKSLVTITSLMVMGKEEQTRIHLNGFLNSGGTINETMALLFYLGKKINAISWTKGFQALQDVLAEREMSKNLILDITNQFNKQTLNVTARASCK